MKTNHNRRFVDSGSFRQPPYHGPKRKLTTRFAQASNIGHSFCCGHRGAARSKAGAKHYLNNQERKDGKLVVQEDLNTFIGDSTVSQEKNLESISAQLTEAGYDHAVAIATDAEVNAGAACGQLSIITTTETRS